MSQSSTSSFSSSFERGRLKPGVYKIQNVYAETFVDIHEHSKELCCRPHKDLEPKKGLVRSHRLTDVGASDD